VLIVIEITYRLWHPANSACTLHGALISSFVRTYMYMSHYDHCAHIMTIRSRVYILYYHLLSVGVCVCVFLRAPKSLP